jgi:hypothetical protein
VAGWTIIALTNGGHLVTHLDDDDDTDEELAGTFGAEVSVEEIINIILANAESADWILNPAGEPLIVAERPDTDES